MLEISLLVTSKLLVLIFRYFFAYENSYEAYVRMLNSGLWSYLEVETQPTSVHDQQPTTQMKSTTHDTSLSTFAQDQ